MKKEEGKKRTGLKIFLVVLIVIIVLVGAGVLWALNFLGILNFGSSGTFTPVNLTAESLPGYLEKQSIVRSLPSDSKINLYLGEEPYFIQGGGVERGLLEDPEVVIYLPESYLEKIGQIGLCSAIKLAVQNKDLTLASEGPGEDLAWKYKALFKYKKCFS